MSPLELAQEFESAIGRLWDGRGVKPVGKSEFSCLAIRHSDAYVMVFQQTLTFKEVMGYYGKMFGVSGRPNRQLARALWLTLLAELAERGELTLRGLE